MAFDRGIVGLLVCVSLVACGSGCGTHGGTNPGDETGSTGGLDDTDTGDETGSTGELCAAPQLSSTDAVGIPRNVLVDQSCNVYVVGLSYYYNELIYVTKLDPTGAKSWTHTYGSGYGGGSAAYQMLLASAQLDGEGNLLLAASMSGVGEFDGITADVLIDNQIALVMKLDSEGRVVWVRGFGTTDQIYIYDEEDNEGEWEALPSGAQHLTVAADGTTYVSGWSAGKVDFDGRVVEAGKFMVALAADGTTKWALPMTVASPIVLALAPSGELVTVGSPDDGSNGMVLAKFDETGAMLWRRDFPGADPSMAEDMSIDAAGIIHVSGRYLANFDLGTGPLPAQRGNQVFVAAFSPDGDTLWTNTLGSTDVTGSQIISSDAGESVVAAHCVGNATIDGLSIEAPFGEDICVVRLDGGGGVLGIASFATLASDSVHDLALWGGVPLMVGVGSEGYLTTLDI